MRISLSEGSPVLKSMLCSRLTAFFLLCALAGSAFGQAKQTKHAAQIESAEVPTMRDIARRLRPGQDLSQQLEAFVKEKQIRAGFIIITVGSLRQAAIRLANQPAATQSTASLKSFRWWELWDRTACICIFPFRTVQAKRLADTWLKGVVIYTTAEILIGDAECLVFTRGEGQRNYLPGTADPESNEGEIIQR
jgi:hypothetical protein